MSRNSWPGLGILAFLGVRGGARSFDRPQAGGVSSGFARFGSGALRAPGAAGVSTDAPCGRHIQKNGVCSRLGRGASTTISEKAALETGHRSQ